MKPADDIKKLFDKAELTTDSQTHEKIFQDVLDAQQETTAPPPAQPEIWRLVMKNPVTKYAIAALIVLAALVGLSLFKGSGNTAWAIDQSIEAVSKYRGLLIEGWDSERSWTEDGSSELRPSKTWALANADQTMVEKYRDEMDGVAILVTNGTKTWRYDPETNTVRVEDRPYVAGECWIGRSFLEFLKEWRDSGVITRWQEAASQDPNTGDERIILSIGWEAARWNGPRSVRLEFDRQSKLPVSFEQWENANWQGPPTLIAETITYYETLPDHLFQFEIPPGATVIEE